MRQGGCGTAWQAVSTGGIFIGDDVVPEPKKEDEPRPASLDEGTLSAKSKGRL